MLLGSVAGMRLRLLATCNALVLAVGLGTVALSGPEAPPPPVAAPAAVSVPSAVPAPPAVLHVTSAAASPAPAPRPTPSVAPRASPTTPAVRRAPTAAARVRAPRAPAPPPSPRPPRPPRTAYRTDWRRPYAVVGEVTLHAPVDVVELIGLHQSGHDGAQPQRLLDTGLPSVVLDDRGRDTRPAGAADVVVRPDGEVRAPVSGTVLRAGSYTLYCRYTDQYLVVEPDEHPGWEVKLLHFEGLAVGKGARVEAGVTVVGSHARRLPFASQVDERTANPAWPHVHIEVVDPSVPDRPSGGGC